MWGNHSSFNDSLSGCSDGINHFNISKCHISSILTISQCADGTYAVADTHKKRKPKKAKTLAESRHLDNPVYISGEANDDREAPSAQADPQINDYIALEEQEDTPKKTYERKFDNPIYEDELVNSTTIASQAEAGLPLADHDTLTASQHEASVTSGHRYEQDASEHVSNPTSIYNEIEEDH